MLERDCDHDPSALAGGGEAVARVYLIRLGRGRWM
jgi:hypothetical protein